MIVFFDANALIYRIEGEAPFAGQVNAALADAAKAHPDLGGRSQPLVQAGMSN